MGDTRTRLLASMSLLQQAIVTVTLVLSKGHLFFNGPPQPDQ